MSGSLAAVGRKVRRRSAALMTQARAIADEVNEPYTHGWVTICEGVRYGLLGEWQRAYDCQRSAESFFDTHCPNRWGGELSTVHFWSLWSCFWLGRLGELQARWPTLMREARERGDSYQKAILGSHLLAVVRMCQERLDGVFEEMHAAVQDWTRSEFHVQHHLKLLGDTAVMIYQGDSAAACDLVHDAVPRYKRSVLWQCQLVRADVKYLMVRLLSAQAPTNIEDAHVVAERDEMGAITGKRKNAMDVSIGQSSTRSGLLR